jgi:Na+-transporting NADH:ubiquinone oxidoreductase subunit C
MPAESIWKTIGIVLGVCIVCSILVSTAAVTLKNKQDENKKTEKLKNILIAGDLLDENQGIEETYNKFIEPVLINLISGEKVDELEFNETLNIQNFDIKTITASPKYGKDIPPEKDLADIKRMPQYMPVYKVVKDNEVQKIILPIYGKGLWSTMYGFMALDKDLKTIKGFTFYEHGETPGLGGEVDNPSWKAIWNGKKAFDDDWNLKIEVIKGRVDPTDANAIYQVDGLSGSTLTTRGVNHLVKFWLGTDGYGAYFKRLRKEMLNEQI